MRLTFQQYLDKSRKLRSDLKLSDTSVNYDEEYKDYLELYETFGDGDLVAERDEDGTVAICFKVGVEQVK